MDEGVRDRPEQHTADSDGGFTMIVFKNSDTEEELFTTVGSDLPIPEKGEVVQGGEVSEYGLDKTTENYLVVERAFGYYSSSFEDEEVDNFVMSVVTLWVEPNR